MTSQARLPNTDFSNNGYGPFLRLAPVQHEKAMSVDKNGAQSTIANGRLLMECLHLQPVEHPIYISPLSFSSNVNSGTVTK